jgi:tRNA(Ile)-lysidine synthase
VKGNLLDNIKRLKSVEAFYHYTTRPVLKKLIQKRGEEIYIAINALFRYNNEALIYDLLHPYGFTEAQIQEVVKLKEADSGSYITAPQTHNRIIKHRAHFIIAPPQHSDTSIFTIEKEATVCPYPGGQLSLAVIEVDKFIVNPDPQVAILNAKDIHYPLILRKWREGDYFYPLGMRKKKKIARFLIDHKFSRTEKENLWVLESNSRIIWVVGYRIDDRFKVTDNTREMLQIERRIH